MTNNEAIGILEIVVETAKGRCFVTDEAISDAYAMAIKALEAQEWIPCKERLPEEDHWLGGSGLQFSDEVLISITHREDEDAWIDISQTIDGEWELELPRYCKITAWKPLPEPYREEENE